MDVLDPAFEDLLRPHLVLLDESATIVPDLELREVGVDSLALIELLVAVEDAYDLEFPDDLLTADTFRTPASLWTIISVLRERSAQQQPAG
ncbi:phosphopantetheine-binding protein [Dactylosporangium sp. CA-139066]|uniref:phosphopantetheine-binding protein n=1 Tax=Dactylosporangium sp. CA-139066 TaxID=3239930 RepID=UPI003D8DC6A0